MVKLGKYNKLKVLRKKEYGFFLDGQTGNTNDDILLLNRFLNENTIEIGDTVEVFIYKDSENRLTATMVPVKAQAEEVALLKVLENTEIGSFVDIGLEKDVLVPFKEKIYPIFIDEVYPFFVYIDKSNRLAASLDIEDKLLHIHPFNIDDTVSGHVYGFQTNKSALICVEGKYAGVILTNEYFKQLKEGDKLENLRVIKIYEDGKLGLSARPQRLEEMTELEKNILSYMEGNDGYMRFNDKADPNDLRIVFNTSKKNFKRTLGTMMKKNILKQDSEGSYLI